MKFEAGVFYGYLVNGNLRGALAYAEAHPDQESRVEKYHSLFAEDRVFPLGTEKELKVLFASYQRYYREVFWLGCDAGEAEERLRQRLINSLVLADQLTLDQLEEKHLVETFRRRGLHFMGGRTGGYRGPYIWRHTEEKTFAVELPEGTQEYVVRFHSGFLTKSWLDYLSFGEISPGGWTNGDGIISCIKDCYDEESQRFQVSLLKHEAQHARDLAAYPDMSQEELEYRAKLVELIYWEGGGLVEEFALQAGEGSGHALAARRIAQEFAEISREEDVHSRAWELFFRSSEELKKGSS